MRPTVTEGIIGPIANLKGPYFQPSLSVCLLARLHIEGKLFLAEFVCESVCLCVCVSLTGIFYPSTLTDFDKTWPQGP